MRSESPLFLLRLELLKVIFNGFSGFTVELYGDLDSFERRGFTGLKEGFGYGDPGL